MGALVQAGLDRLEVGEQPAARIDQVPPWEVSITPRPTRSSSGTPVWRSSRLTCWETALGV